MSTKLEEIQQAIDRFDIDGARQLLRDELQNNPDEDIYYLAAQVAINDSQRHRFLNQVLELDPFHQEAYNELEALNHALMPSGYTMPQPVHSQTSPKYWNNYRLASSSKRFVAVVIDLAILWFVGYITGLVLGLFVPAPIRASFSYTRDFIQAYNTWLAFFYFVGILINATYYITTLTYMNGQTLGKRAMKLRVIKKDGSPITELDAFLRNVVGYFVSTIVIFIGFIWAIFDDEKQGWHDKIAGTVVVVDEPQKSATHSN